jgi:SAM-dependent methyltransferase
LDPRFSGEGPGRQTPDGCSVDLYRRMPYLGELEDVIGLFTAGASVLELGCGTGRLCARLSLAGCAVTGVDESADMLAALPAHVRPVHSSIGDLSLNDHYDAVLLASHLINHPDPPLRLAFVQCARRHLKPGGLFVLERHDPDWLRTARPGPAGEVRDVTIHLEDVTREEPLVRMRLRYELQGQVWRHAFTAGSLSEADVEALLVEGGFAEIRWRGERRLWASATAADI